MKFGSGFLCVERAFPRVCAIIRTNIFLFATLLLLATLAIQMATQHLDRYTYDTIDMRTTPLYRSFRRISLQFIFKLLYN